MASGAVGPTGVPNVPLLLMSRRLLPHCHGNLPLFLCLPERSRDWPEALHWYSTALERTDYDEGGEYDGMQDEPRHALLAREAEMLSTGGCGLQKDPQRAGGRGLAPGTRSLSPWELWRDARLRLVFQPGGEAGPCGPLLCCRIPRWCWLEGVGEHGLHGAARR